MRSEGRQKDEIAQVRLDAQRELLQYVSTQAGELKGKSQVLATQNLLATQELAALKGLTTGVLLANGDLKADKATLAVNIGFTFLEITI